MAALPVRDRVVGSHRGRLLLSLLSWPFKGESLGIVNRCRGTVRHCPDRGTVPHCPGPGTVPQCPGPGTVPHCPGPGTVPHCPGPGTVPRCPGPASLIFFGTFQGKLIDYCHFFV